VVHVDPSKYGRYVGTYDFIKVTQAGNHLMAEIPPWIKTAGVISGVRHTILPSRCSNAHPLRRQAGWKRDWAGVHHQLRSLAQGKESVDIAQEPTCWVALGPPRSSIASIALLVLPCFVVLFAALHNWIPLGALNSVQGVIGEFRDQYRVFSRDADFKTYRRHRIKVIPVRMPERK
jgi:hypothetical protein